MNTQSITQVQEDAIAYLLSRTRRDFRVKRKATRMVSAYCKAQGYSEAETGQCVRDMWDMFDLENNAK